MTLTSFWGRRPALGMLLAALSTLAPAGAQISGVAAIVTPPKTVARRGAEVAARITVQMRSGYHVNSNTPSEDYLIPLRLSWESAPFEVVAISYPKPHMEKYSFSPKPLSVFTGDFEIVTRLKTPSNAPQGPGILLGKLRYQACNDNSCLPPKTVEVRLPYQIQ